jgi:hypothetical protein
METTTKKPTTQQKYDQLVKEHPMLKHFAKFYAQDQEGKNDYEKGCIQSADVFFPVLIEILINSDPKTI